MSILGTFLIVIGIVLIGIGAYSLISEAVNDNLKMVPVLLNSILILLGVSLIGAVPVNRQVLI